MAQDQGQRPPNNSGFVLPAPADPASAGTPYSGTENRSTTPTAYADGSNANEVDTSTRDLLVGGGILLVLFVGFFFAKNAYANTLVAKRVPPNKANAAGWWLFVFVASLATGVVLAAVNAARFLSPLIIGPVAAVGLVALVLMILSGRK